MDDKKQNHGFFDATLIEGRFDAELIASWLDQTAYFIQPSDVEPWRIVIKFDERSVANVGEFLHIAALHLIMAEQNISGRTMEEEATLCLAYINDLLDHGRVPAKSLEYVPYDSLFKAFGGYDYWVSETSSPHFKVICEHVDQAMDRALEATYPGHVAEILRQLREELSSICQTISNSGQPSLADIPILAHIPVKSFMDAWLSGPRNGWRQTRVALDNRYVGGQLERRLCDERSWLIKLEREMDDRIFAQSCNYRTCAPVLQP